MGYIKVLEMTPVQKEKRTCKERIILDLANKYHEKHELVLITYELDMLEQFQAKCSDVFGDEVGTSVCYPDFAIQLTVYIDNNKEFVINEAKKIANELNLEIEINTESIPNIINSLEPIIKPIYTIGSIFNIMIIKPVTELIIEKKYSMKKDKK